MNELAPKRQIIAATRLNSALYARAQQQKALERALALGEIKNASIYELRLRRANERVAMAEKSARETGAL